MKKLLFRSDGTVTIFCALIMMFLTIFLMVLLDYARILLFQRTTESALKLSAQSVIAAYDRELYQQYGLFARGGTSAEKLFKEAIGLNLMNSISVFSLDQGSDFVQPRLESVELFEGDYLGQHPIFERQILEEMKYRAPIDFTIELLEQWLPITNAVNEAEAIINVIEELESLYVDREQILEEILQAQLQIGEQINDSEFEKAVNSSAPSTLNSYTSYISWLAHEDSLNEKINELYELLSLLEPDEEGQAMSDSEVKIREQLEKLEEERDKYSTQISSYTTKAAKVIATISTEGDQLVLSSQRAFEEIDHLLREARTLDNTIRNKYRLYLKQENEQVASSSHELEREIKKLSFDETMIRGDQYFVSYREAIQLQQRTLDAIANDGKSLASEISSLVNQPQLYVASNLESAKKAAASLKEKIYEYNDDYHSPAALIIPWEQELKQQREVQAQLDQYEAQFEEASLGYKDIMKLFAEMEDVKNAAAPYEAVEHRYELNLDRNLNMGVGEGIEYMELSGSSKQQATSAASMLKTILHMLSGSVESLRDVVYVNEYALSKFSSFPMGELSPDSGLSTELLELSEQEIEYILYGIEKPLANVITACGSIFAVRFAIRTIEGLIANRGLSHPLLILGAAVVHGMKEAIADMKQLLTKGYTELSRYAPLEISYPQYLRLLFMLPPYNHASRLARIIALIEHQFDLSLLTVPTSVTIQAEFSMRLWSVPGLTKLTGAGNLMDSGVVGNAYFRRELVAASY